MSTVTAMPRAEVSYDRIPLDRSPSEMPLFVFSLLIALPIWALIIVTFVGLLYGLAIGAFLFVMHVGFVSHVRGSAVRLGPDQFPELHERVTLLAQRLGLERVPEAYLMQAGGSLNAFATRFLRSNMIVLFSDLLEECNENDAARDMIIAHELGHIRAGHLRWRWLIAPSMIVPFLSMALSRAREYTCDRIGADGAGDRDGALLGLTILAAGGRYGRLVNREAFVAQRAAFASGWMTIGEWLSTHPPLAKRLVAIEPSLAVGRHVSSGAARAIGILLLVVLGGTAVVTAGVVAFTRISSLLPTAQTEQTGTDPFGSLSAPAGALDDPTGMALQARADLNALSSFLDDRLASGFGLPQDEAQLAALWEQTTGQPLPTDPFDGVTYGYAVEGDSYLLWSSGPDGESATADDINATNQ